MKTKFKYFSLAIAALLMVGFASCSSDDDTIKGVDEIETGGTKMQLVVNMPTGASTRSTTGLTSTEVGTEDENKATKVLLAIFDATTGAHVVNYEQALVLTSTGEDKVNYQTQVFEADALTVGGKYKVYVYVNPYPEMDQKANDVNAFFKPWDTALTEEARYLSVMNGITKERGFFMSSATEVEVNEVLSTAENKATPFKVVANVERAVARFDYTAKNATNVYPVGESSDVSIKFTDYKLINTSKQFFHLKRVNTLGDLSTGTQGGVELVGNFVVDTDWEAKSKAVASWDPYEFANNFYFNMRTTEPVAGYKSLGTSTSESQNLSYVIENTLPLINQSKKGLATAVVFKGKLVFTPSKFNVQDNENVYVWNNKFYGPYANLPAGVKSIVGNQPEDITKTNLEKAGVTAYKWDPTLEGGGGYPVYYVYYNRHNDNNDGTTGPMEFAVVRNNVYKLSINGVKLFGHPEDPQIHIPTLADPNPEKPEDDIETDHIYMDVTANVLPWTVRTNVIEF